MEFKNWLIDKDRLGHRLPPRVLLNQLWQVSAEWLAEAQNDATIIATGIMVAKALEAAENLSHQAIECRVLSMPTLKPLDEGAVIQAAAETGAIVTAEEHLEHGGLGSRVASSNRLLPSELAI